jgi:hypothetical protein
MVLGADLHLGDLILEIRVFYFMTVLRRLSLLHSRMESPRSCSGDLLYE